MKENKGIFKYAFFFILALVFITIWICIQTGSIQTFDSYIYQLVKNMRTDMLTAILKGITELGSTVGLFFIALITVIIMFILKKRKIAIGVTLNLLISSITYVVLKNIFQRPRPPIEERLIEETGYSFPSGHSTNNMAFYVFAIYLIYKNIKNRKIRNVLCVILGIIPILIGFSRVYLRVHYPSDVISGFCLGIILVIVFKSFVYKKLK